MAGVKVVEEMEKKMQKSIEALKDELSRIHVGRANPEMIEDIQVEYYGTQTPLNQIANITAPDPSLMAVQPYDESQIDSIEKAILEADLGLNPNDDGSVVRIPVPKLSGERREELTNMIEEEGEETKIAIRNIRRETNKELDDLEEDGEITEDDNYRLQEEVDELTKSYTSQVDDLLEKKGDQIRSL
ncbi:MAG: ribosome recycling factor [Candidatus Acetothermia bacterium]